MKKPEILCPAGDMASLKAAVLGGCDAIYLGGYVFGARAFSKNFSNDEICAAIDYAHAYGIKVYVAVNTLVYDDEVEMLMDYVDFLHKNNVDAIIIQDIGMADLIHQTYPNLELHASTQMHIHNLEGVKFAEKLGIKRVVLARETPIDLIENIKKNSKSEIEIFVHGALCVSYSGQCLMSSLIGGRSGNRGTCAGSCRLKYDVLDAQKNKVNKDEYNLSTKDLNTLENIGKLIDAGVDSLKIEGRMKSPAYVYYATKLYRQAVDSYFETGNVDINQEYLNDLNKTFSRGYTKGFIFNEENSKFINPYRPNHQGVEIGKVISCEKGKVKIKLTDELSINDGIRFVSKEDDGLIVTRMFVNDKKVTEATSNDIVTIYTDKKASPNSKVLKTTDSKLNIEMANILNRTSKKIKVTGKIMISPNEKMRLEISDGKFVSSMEGNIKIEKAKKVATTKDQIRKQICKTGGTVFDFQSLDIEYNEDSFVPVSELNELRRKTVENLFEMRIVPYKKEYKKSTYKRDVKEYEMEPLKTIYVQSLEQVKRAQEYGYDLIYVDSDLYDAIEDKTNIIKKLSRVIEQHRDCEVPLLVGELGSVEKYDDIVTDFSLNVVNSYFVALLNSLGVKRITLSYEMNDDQIKTLIDSYKKRYNKNPNLSLIVYAKEEMMISKFKLLSYYKLGNIGYLRDKFSNLYEIREKENLMQIYNYKPRYMHEEEKYYKMGINELRYNVLELKEIPKKLK